MPSNDKWVIKMWYIYTLESYSATNRNEIKAFAGKWIEIENIMLNEVVQTLGKNSIYSL